MFGGNSGLFGSKNIFPMFSKTASRWIHTIRMATFVILGHPVTTLVTAFNDPKKLTNDLRILKIFDNKQIISLNRCCNKTGNIMFHIFDISDLLYTVRHIKPCLNK